MAKDSKDTSSGGTFSNARLAVPLTSYDRFILRNRGLVPGTPAYSIAAGRMKGISGAGMSIEESKKNMALLEDAENTGYKKVGLAGTPVERNTRIAKMLAAMPGYSDIAQAIIASVSPIRAIGGPKS